MTLRSGDEGTTNFFFFCDIFLLSIYILDFTSDSTCIPTFKVCFSNLSIAAANCYNKFRYFQYPRELIHISGIKVAYTQVIIYRMDRIDRSMAQAADSHDSAYAACAHKDNF